MAYSYSQLRDIWIRNGGSTGASYIAAAIAMAESGGNPLASHVNSDGSTDRGLWQINSIHGGLSTFDINANARAAVQISGNGTNWHPWTVYNTGAYKKYVDLNAVGQPVGPNDTGSEVGDPSLLDQLNPATAISNLTKPFINIADSLSQVVKAGTWFSNPHNVIRIAQVSSGIGLAIIGLLILSRGLVEEAVGNVIKGAIAA